MKYIIGVLLIGLCFSSELTSPQLLLELQSRTENVIDDGLALLNALYDSAAQGLDQVISETDGAMEHLKEDINNAESELHEAQNECMVISDDLALMKSQYDYQRVDIVSFEEQIVMNKKRLETLEILRCQSSTEWLNFVRQGKYVLNLIQFLRHAIENYNSFSEIKNFNALLQTLQSEDFNDQDILHSLDTLGKSRGSLAPVKQELLQLLDSIEKSVKSKINTSQSDEVLTSSRIGDYQVQLSREIQFLDNEIRSLNEKWGDQPEQTLQDKQKELDQCESQIQSKVDTAKQVKDQVAEKEIQHEELKSKLIRERDIVQELIDEYQKGFQKIADAYKLRIQDYHEDGIFDKTEEFDNRTLQQYYGDKQTQLDEYADQIVRGEVEPIVVEQQQTQTEQQSESESESEETEQTEENQGEQQEQTEVNSDEEIEQSEVIEEVVEESEENEETTDVTSEEQGSQENSDVIEGEIWN